MHTKGCICNSVILQFLGVFLSKFLHGDRDSLSTSDTTVSKGALLVQEDQHLEDQPPRKQTKTPCIWCYHVPIFHPHFIISFCKSSEAWKSSVWGRKACFGEGLRETSQAAVLTYLLGRLYTNAKRHWKMCFIWHRTLRAPRPSAPPPQSLSHCQQWPFPPSLSRQPSLMVFLCPFNTTRWLDNQSDFIVRQWWLINNNFLFKQESSRGSLS